MKYQGFTRVKTGVLTVNIHYNSFCLTVISDCPRLSGYTTSAGEMMTYHEMLNWRPLN